MSILLLAALAVVFPQLLGFVCLVIVCLLLLVPPTWTLFMVVTTIILLIMSLLFQYLIPVQLLVVFCG